jgi:hypothetical protein
MIIPIHGLKYYEFCQPIIGEEVLLLKEKDNLFDPKAIAAFNNLNQQLGYIGARSNYNKKVYSKWKLIHSHIKSELLKCYLWQILDNIDSLNTNIYDT